MGLRSHSPGFGQLVFDPKLVVALKEAVQAPRSVNDVSHGCLLTSMAQMQSCHFALP